MYLESETRCTLCGDVLIDEEGYRVERRTEFLDRSLRRVMWLRYRMSLIVVTAVLVVGALGPYVEQLFGWRRGAMVGGFVLAAIIVIVVLGLRHSFSPRRRERVPPDDAPDGYGVGHFDVDFSDFGGGGDGGGGDA